MNIRIGLIGGDELVRRGLESMLRTLGGFEMGSIKERVRAPLDIALVETYGTSLEDTTLARAVADRLDDPALRADQIARQSAALDRMGRDRPDPSAAAADVVLSVAG